MKQHSTVHHFSDLSTAWYFFGVIFWCIVITAIGIYIYIYIYKYQYIYKSVWEHHNSKLTQTRKSSANADIRRKAAWLSFEMFRNRIAIDLDLCNGPRRRMFPAYFPRLVRLPPWNFYFYFELDTQPVSDSDFKHANEVNTSVSYCTLISSTNIIKDTASSHLLLQN